MPVIGTTNSSLLSRRQLELRLLLFSMLIVVLGMGLTFLGKLSTTAPAAAGSLNINTATAADYCSTLLIDRNTADALVKYRDALPGHAFASVYRLRRAPVIKGLALSWDWQTLTVRSVGDVARAYFVALLLLAISFISVHILLRRSAVLSDPFLLPIVFLLCGFGLMVALTVHDPLRDTFAFTTQALGVICLGPVALLVPLTKSIRKLPLHRYTYMYAGGAVLLLVLLLTFGRGPAATHIELLGFEPIEIIKVLLVFFIAAYLADRRMSVAERPKRKLYIPSLRDMLPLLAIYLFALSLFGAVKDLGPAVLLFGSFVAMLYLITGQAIYPALGLVLLMIAAYLGDKLGIGFFATRVEMWLHPWDNSNRLGGQLAQGLWGISTGGIFGSGLGLGGSSFIPRAGSDMAFTTIGEELGLVGGLFVLFLYVVIIFRGFQIARNALDDFDRLLAGGITILIGLQALVITGGATGLMPLTGITLPFISYGTSSLIANFFCIGVLLHISAKSTASQAEPASSQVFITASRRVALTLSAGLLLFVGIGRLVWLQGIDDTATATRSLWIPDADRVYRVHRNPRLTAYALNIPRGVIRDRNGVLLAGDPKSGHGITFLTDGVPRIYPLGATAADVVYAVEQPSSELNPLGSDEALRGYRTLEDLLPYYRCKDLPFSPSPVGKDVTLTIDIGLQRIAQEALVKVSSRLGNGRGAAVVLNARTGALLAAATSPTFNPNALTADSWNALHSSSDPSEPLLNRAFAGTYVPGSVFKLVTATCAFENQKTDLTFNCNHLLPVVHWTFNGKRYSRRNITDDEEFQPHGQTDLTNAIRVSCNVYFSQLGVVIGAEALERTIQEYSLHECPSLSRLGADLPDCAYGQGTIEVTPYQMANVCQTIANSGKLAPPNFFLNQVQPVSAKTILSAADANSLGSMMAGVVTSGTAAGVFPGLSVAGKTGSAQLASGKPHSWFVGFAPVSEPSIAFACVVEHGGHGRTAAAVVCKDIVETAVR